MNVYLNTKQYPQDIIDRFAAKVEKTDKCWLWSGDSRGDLAVAQFQICQGTKVSARKFAYWLWVGIIPDGRMVQTTCGNKMCVNPKHLILSHGRPDLVLNANDIQRFEPNVDKSGGPEACWPWIGSKVATGSTNKTHVYGQFSLAGTQARAHRVAYALAHNIPTPKHLQVRHTCDNPICCNPAHLVLGTAAQNGQDKSDRGRASKLHGEGSPVSKLTQAQVDEMRKLRGVAARYQKHKRYRMTLKDLAKKFDVSLSLVGKICAGDMWKSA